MDTGIEVKNMRLMRPQVENVRAVFDVVVGSFRLKDCFLLGKLQDDPCTLRVCLPGKRSRNQTKWVASVECTDLTQLDEITEKALMVYQRLVDRSIERLANLYMRQNSGQIVASFLTSG
jgi:hypothetical protein